MHEGPHHSAPQDHDDVMLDRRDFLRFAGASLALAGLDGCTRLPAEHILPYVDSRPELTPGVAQYYATAMCIDGYATGLIVESHVGRPTKIEGNPDHPASLGASGPLEQASVLQLYDPDRAKSARIGTSPAEWSAIAATLAPAALHGRLGPGGRGLHLLIEPTSSPLDEEWLARIAAAYPEARIHMYAPLVPERATTPLVQQYDFSAADVILAVDSDFLASGPFHLRYARQFADGRRLAQPTDRMNRLYVIESSFTPTGSAADHRFAVRPGELAPLLGSLLASITGSVNTADAPAWVRAVAHDLVSHSGRSIVVLGASHAPEVRALVSAINAAINANDHTTWCAPSPLIGARVQLHPFSDLQSALEARAVDTLIIVGGNPAYTTPAALGFAALVANVPNSGYVGLYENETARAARWFVPMSHYLERWGDARAYDGSLSIVQPLITPLYRSIAPCTLYATLAGAAPSDAQGYDLLRASWCRPFRWRLRRGVE